MAKHVYHTEKSFKINERTREILLELPSICTSYLRSISQTTSPMTRLAYAYDLRLFFTYLTQETVSFANTKIPLMSCEDLSRITTQDIEGFQDYLIQYVKINENQMQDTSPSSPVFIQNKELGIMRKLCSLRSFYKYLFKNELIPANIAVLVSLPKKKNKPIIYLEQDEVKQMLSTVISGEGLTDKQKAYLEITRTRDAAILMLFLGSGIRVSELVGINISDIDFERNSFLVTRKGGDQSILYYPDAVGESLLAYHTERSNLVAIEGHEDAFFLSLQKKRITTRAVENLVKKYAAIAAPLKKKISPHKLRSTYGTNLYLETNDIYLVADALGHSDVNTTRRHYAAMTDSRKREAANHVYLPTLSTETQKDN